MGCLVDQRLADVGRALDWNRFPSVANGGVVIPGTRRSPSFEPGEESENVTQWQQPEYGAGRSQSGQGPRPERWQGAPCWIRPRPPREATSLVSQDLVSRYKAELAEVEKAYPKTKTWAQNEGIWILVRSSLVEGNTQIATFAVWVPFSPFCVPRAWGFWNGLRWIGPRHTNYPDGSICAFEPKDQTWVPGDSLVQLLDLYSVWALRHLYFERFGRWPGFQVLHSRFERWSEAKDGEFCGCNKHNTVYENCCYRSDRGTKLLSNAVSFVSRSQFLCRRPPASVIKFMRFGGEPPSAKNGI